MHRRTNASVHAFVRSCVRAFVRSCVCVCVRERERGRKREESGARERDCLQHRARVLAEALALFALVLKQLAHRADHPLLHTSSTARSSADVNDHARATASVASAVRYVCIIACVGSKMSDDFDFTYVMALTACAYSQGSRAGRADKSTRRKPMGNLATRERTSSDFRAPQRHSEANDSRNTAVLNRYEGVLTETGNQFCHLKASTHLVATLDLSQPATGHFKAAQQAYWQVALLRF
eukprot:6196080-Pleurochrysis_carterae.AAC.2